ncbi:UNVERIFIED_ORG: DedD protein [Zoogloea ramigera]|uniref:SPOR domain-containing protein n=1 Tax=Duganella zoogloeoides TaxID=75659 RepID=A0ABZ0Y382_9BURK|nr:SPOR domain-containing protein [Duganella zoogloeoides]WQH05876.1 SPOR domain-containing protein [Duganella zoogloeoides]
MGLFSKFGKNKQESAQDSGYYTSADDQAALERARSKRASSTDGPRRRSRDREADDPVLPEKKRARRRLVGAIALALAVAVGLPMLLDSEPKPLASDIDIKIPSKERSAGAPAVGGERRAATIPDSDTLDSREEIVEDAKPAAAVAAKPAAKPETGLSAQAQAHSDELDRSVAASEARAKAEADARNKQEADRRAEQERKREAERKLADAKAGAKAEADARTKAREEAKAKADARAEADRKLAESRAADIKAAEAKAAAKPAAESKQAQDARALAILEGKTAKPPGASNVAAESGQKFVLQVAALSDQAKVSELRERLKQAGINSYTQKAPSGEVTRVRVGPFSSKEEAEKVRAKLQSMGLAGRLETV